MMFHPFEIAFCGLSGSGKTTLITRVIRHFRLKGHEPAYFKHGCHRFDIDREGKDSYLARQAGALSVMISDPEKEALIATGSGSLSSTTALLSADMLFIEGLKELPIPKLLFVDAGRLILPTLAEGAVRNVVALVHDGHAEGLADYGLPLLNRDDTDAVTGFIERHFEACATNVPLYGLVLAGGRSSRMGRDKALIDYRGENQLLSTASLLSRHCPKVFVSCRQEQKQDYLRHGLPAIADTYLDMGPMGGLLSAQRGHPDAAWFIAACDFPFLNQETIGELTSKRNPFRFATALHAACDRRPEPLLTIYEPKSRQRLLQQHGNGNDSLSSFLQHARTTFIELRNPEPLRNVNDEAGVISARCSLAFRRPYPDTEEHGEA
jgi:molybdopterin-guanine dinucleotide biosynthesis protein A